MTEFEWYEAMKAKGHMPIMDDDDPLRLSFWVMDSGFHNGPGCSACGWSCCEHCTDLEDIPECNVIDLTVAPPAPAEAEACQKKETKE